MEKIVFFGKGGIGKSTISTNIATIYALQGYKVLHVGCDPKHDSSMMLVDRSKIPTVIEEHINNPTGLNLNKVILKGRCGVDCIESGGPSPGVGCGGRGISRMLELFEENSLIETGKYDIIIFDVLGDVVCGGFAAPLRRGFGEKIFIVISEELMSLYAANNISKAVCTYSSNGVVLGGLIANLRNSRADRKPLTRFSELLGTEIIKFIPRSPLIREAEYNRRTVVEYAPNSKIVKDLKELAKKILKINPREIKLPTPIEDQRFYEYLRTKFMK